VYERSGHERRHDSVWCYSRAGRCDRRYDHHPPALCKIALNKVVIEAADGENSQQQESERETAVDVGPKDHQGAQREQRRQVVFFIVIGVE
jgi:hypothetical protein